MSMNIILFDKTSISRKVLCVDAVPRKGDYVDFGYTPLPSVDSVIWFPEKAQIECMHKNWPDGKMVSAIVICS